MIEFVSNISYCDKNVKKMYPDLIKDEVHFIIRVEDKLFFEEPNFSIYEFMCFVDEWIEKNLDDMKYIAIDTDDNPLISFIKDDGGYKINSPWQLFSCEKLISREEIEEAILKLKK